MRVVVIILAVICAIVGLLTLIGGIIAKDNTFLELADVSGTVFLIGLIFGIVMMLFSFSGIYGVVKGRRCCIFLFCIVLGILAIVLIAIVIMIAVVQSSFEETYQYMDCSNSNNTYLQDLEDAYTSAASMLCKTDNCACNYEHDYSTYPSFKYNATGPVNAVSCPDFDSKKYGYSALLMLGVESAFKCTGVCDDPKPVGMPRLYYFSNINNSNGVAPNQRCQDDIWNFLYDQINSIKTIMLIVMIVALVSFVFIVVLFYIGRGKTPEWSDNAEDRLIEDNHYHH